MTYDFKPSLEGYSVAKIDTQCGIVYRVYRNDICVAAISCLGKLFRNKLAFEWHDRRMWNYRVQDFIIH